jgi:hypothetical protein
MNKIKLLLLVVYPLFASFGIAQSVKPAFKKFVYVTYEPSPSGKSIVIDYLLEVDEFGTVHYKSKYDDGIGDTTYKMPDSLITELNKIANGKRKLKSYMTINKLPDGEHFAGPLEFMSLTADNGISDNFIVVMPFMTQDFIEIMDKVSYLRFPRLIQKGKTMATKTLMAKIINYQNASKYIPKIEEPPTVQ